MRMWRKEPLYTAGGAVNGAAAVETICKFLKKLKIEILYDMVIPLPGTHPKGRTAAASRREI